MMRSCLPILFTALLVAACGEPIRRPPGGNNNNNNGNNCGNGRIDQGETCDKSIPTSSVGACLSTCFDGIACTQDIKTGDANSCNVACSFTAISACVNDDRCCPVGCMRSTDNDCPLAETCNGGQVDPGETCDGNCPMSCDDRSSCTRDTQYGEAAACSLACGYQVIAGCMAGDGCCPEGCSSQNDSDCSTMCGNGTVDTGETCDGDCQTTCTPADACSLAIKSGSAANCNFSCTQQRITACVGGDGCCGAGCSNATDSDCPASCAVVTTCQGGDGCCPTSCNNGNDSDCPVLCSQVTVCRNGDTCCPGGCNNGNDNDCPVGGTTPVGDPCTMSMQCAALPGASAMCIMQSGWFDGYCSAVCSGNAQCPSGSLCSPNVTPPACIKTCASPQECRSGYICNTLIDFQENPFTGCVGGG